MPISYHNNALLSGANFNSYPAEGKNSTKEINNDSGAIKKLKTINNTTDVFNWQSEDAQQPSVYKGFRYYFTQWFSPGRRNQEYNSIELDTILTQGRRLRQDAEDVSEQLQLKNKMNPPAFTLKTKVGLFMGAVLLLAGGGVGIYRWRNTETEGHNASKSDNSSIIAEKSIAEDTYSNVGITPEVMILKRSGRHYPERMNISEKKTETKTGGIKSVICINDEDFHFDYLSGKLIKKENTPCSTAVELFPEHNRPVNIDDQIPECEKNKISQYCDENTYYSKNENNITSNKVITIQGVKCFCPFQIEKKIPTEIDTHEVSLFVDEKININSYQNNDQTLLRCRDRLISYINLHVEVPKNVEDKNLARLILTLISGEAIHEYRLAQIYLYGTGLYGEKIDEYISINVQRQLVGELLAQLFYGQSLDKYLIAVFSVNRYISIKDYKLKILKDHSDYDNSELTSEMRFFYERYIVPVMPVFSLNLSDNSLVLVGSITWFLMYLSSEAEWLEAINYDEKNAIMHGIDVLNYLANGELYEASKIKIEIGLMFCVLYLKDNINPQNLPSFRDSLDIVLGELKLRVDLSSKVVKKIREIVSGMKEIENEQWYSINKFSDSLLVKYCKTQNINLFLLKNPADGLKHENIKFISKLDFINLIDDHAWCVIQKERILIKIPNVNKEYLAVIKFVIDVHKKANEFFIKNNFILSDYFNPSLSKDDFSFIDSAALDIVSLRFNEHRYIQERLIGSPLRKINTKSEYLFFRATHVGEERIYALDKTYKKLMQRVKIDSINSAEDIGEFFDGQSSYNDKLINIVVYKDLSANISISEQEPSSLFYDKVVEWQNKIIEDMLYKHATDEAMSIEETIMNIFKELFIPFYSCATSLKGEDATDAFVSCFLDGVFLVFPAVKKIFSIGKKVTERSIDLFFMANKNNVFKKDGHILWSKFINDFYIYNTILNEKTMIRNSVIDLIIDSIDPGFGLIKDMKNLVFSTASMIIKGGCIRLSIFSLNHIKNIAEFSVRAKSIIDSSKKITVKVSKSSGRLSMSHYHENDDSSVVEISEKYGSFYQFGDYYVYYSNRNEVDVLLGITEETTEDGEHIHVILSEDEFSGIIFRIVFEKNTEGKYSMLPWVSYASQMTKIMASDSRLTGSGYQMHFKHDRNKPLENLVYYPEHQCYLSENGFSKGKVFDIFKISGDYYILDPENKYFLPLYDGDFTEIRDRDKSMYFHKIIKTEIDDIIINSENITMASEDSPFKIEYSLSGNFSIIVEASENKNDKLYFSYDKLFFGKRDRFYELGLSTIKKQFMLSQKKLGYPSLMIGWDSLKNEFVAAKPYLKKTSSHVGEALESFVNDQCEKGERLEKFPTLLLSGAVSSRVNIKIRILNYYYPLELLDNGLFHLNCLSYQPNSELTLYYDLFTESFELLPSNPKNSSSKNDYESPYDVLINQHFSKEKYPDISDLINLNKDNINNKLTMRLRQAAFLKRLNPIDRLDTLQLPLAQIYSWELHHDTQSFQRKYSAAALWMTWQRQLYLLLKNESSSKLTLIDKIYLRDDSSNDLFCSNDILINIKYINHDAVWMDSNGRYISQVLGSSLRVYKNNSMFSEDGFIEWFPKGKYSNVIPVTQFMYEKDVNPRIMIDLGRGIVKVIDGFFEETMLNSYSKNSEFEYFIISPNKKWLVSLDNKRNVMFYDLHEKGFGHREGMNSVIYAMSYSTLIKCTPENYFLFLLTDDGTLFCPQNNVWGTNDGDNFLWTPPTNFAPAFISQDQRFLGFKNKENFNTIIYDQRRKKDFLLTRPAEQHDNGNITAVSFSAMNAVLALAFDDGNIFLYDLIREHQGSIFSPIAYVKLNNKVYNNILMRFEGFFESLTVIHPEGIKNKNKELDDMVFIYSSYGFNGIL